MTTASPSKYFDVEIYSHYFLIKNANPIGMQLLFNFVKQFVQFEMVKENRVWKRKPVKTFGARIACKNEFRFHIGCIEKWRDYIKFSGLLPDTYTETTFGFFPIHPIDVTFTTEKQPRDYQIEINKYNMSPLPSKRKFVGIKPGKGKSVKNGTKVRIPGGWKAIETLRPGEYIVAADGTITTVAGVYPQGLSRLYEVVFEDGRRAQYCGEHVWPITDESEPKRRRAKEINTLELKELLENATGRISIPLPAIEKSGAKLPHNAQPYQVGVLAVMQGDEISSIYLNSVAKHRRSVLSGILDTAGKVRESVLGRYVEFSTEDLKLAKSVIYLVRSLSGKASIKEENNLYVVDINLPDPWIYFNNEDTSNLLLDSTLLIPCNQRLTIVSVTEVSPGESTCISIDHASKLFVLEDFIVSHNTFIAGWMAAQLGGRIVSFLKSEYLEKWPGDLKELLGIDLKDTAVVSGSAQLMAVIAAAKEGELRSKAVLVSSRTFQNFISLYEKHGDAVLNMGYDCLPHEFCQVLGASLRIIDEVHREFHNNFKIDLYTHIEWSISLTATLISDDTFISQMHEIAYPKAERCQVEVVHKYITTNALRYRITKPDKRRTTEFGSNNYSHIAFEKNFFKDDRLLSDYLAMIGDRFAMQYLIRKDPGQKCLIYAASIKMCTLITDYLQQKYPELKVRRFVEDDPYENLMDSDVAISTIGSAGTGHDIKNLITVILTTAIASTATNIQGFGRLRDIPGVETVFEYFVCMDIVRHCDYHFKKEVLLKMEALKTGTEDYLHVIGN